MDLPSVVQINGLNATSSMLNCSATVITTLCALSLFPALIANPFAATALEL